MPPSAPRLPLGSPADDDGTLHAVIAFVEAACAGLDASSIAARLQALAALNAALSEVTCQALRQSMIQAHGEGWSLRRIAVHAGCSHEQVRQLLRDA